MLIQTEDLGEVRVLHLNQTVVGYANAEEVARELSGFVPPHAAREEVRRPVILDLSGLTAVDVSGLGMLLKWLREARKEGGGICVYGVSGQVRALFEMLSLHETVPVCESREEAILYFLGPREKALRATA